MHFFFMPEGFHKAHVNHQKEDAPCQTVSLFQDLRVKSPSS